MHVPYHRRTTMSEHKPLLPVESASRGHAGDIERHGFEILEDSRECATRSDTDTM